MRNGYFTVLVATLLLVRHLVFDLDAASTRFDHALGQQVSGFCVTETSVDVGNNRHNVSLVVVDLALQLSRFSSVASVTSSIQLTEQATQLTGVGLTQEGVQFFDQTGYRSLLVHGLIRQRAEVGTQGGNHPTGQVQVTTLGVTQVLFDGNQFLLTDETVPATQRLSVLSGIGIVGSHVFTHDLGCVLGNIQTGFETVLQTHTSNRLRADRVPGGAIGSDYRCCFISKSGVVRHGRSSTFRN